MKILITGGAGFIGSAVVRRAIAEGLQVVNVDALTYSANLENVASVADRPGYAFEQADICDAAAMKAIFAKHQPETVISRALEGKSIPVYGDGRQVRDWLHVDDHAEALLLVLGNGRLCETYCVGGDGTKRNIELITILCGHLDRLAPANTPHAEKIHFVTDPPG